MTRRPFPRWPWIGLLAAAAAFLAGAAAYSTAQSAGGSDSGDALRIVAATPASELPSLADAREIRIVFSEPMVAIGATRADVRPPFVTISPAIPGRFRWSGTTILIFTPDPAQPLPYATRFTVTVDGSATAVSGRKLGKPFSFTFTTPTVKLAGAHWYRRDGRAGGPLVLGLTFNQPVRPANVLAHLAARYERHDWSAPRLSAPAIERLRKTDPKGLAAYEAKVDAALRAAASSAPVPLRIATSWDRNIFPPSPTLVVVEPTTVPPVNSWLRLTLDAKTPSPQGREVPGVVQSTVLELEPAFFVIGPECESQCDPSAWNPVRFTTEVTTDSWRRALRVIDVTDGKDVSIARREAAGADDSTDPFDRLTLEDAGFERQPAARRYVWQADASLTAADGQVLGYPWLELVTTSHEKAFTSFGDGHGVWETSGGTTLPFHARNLQQVTQYVKRLTPDELMPRVLAMRHEGRDWLPSVQGTVRKLPVTPDRIQSHGFDLSAALGSSRTGLVWAGVEEGAAIAGATHARPHRRTSTLVQVTNLGVSVKDSPDNTLIFVTRLDNGAPVADARVWIVRTDNRVFWEGRTNADGVAIAPETPLRDPARGWELAFAVLAEKDGDVAYVVSDWNEGISPWQFGLRYDVSESLPRLRGSVFTDRGVYRLGEQVQAKAILRLDTLKGISLLPSKTPIYVTLRDPQYREIEMRTVTLGDWSSAEWTVTLPTDAALGSWLIEASLDDPAKPAPPPNPNEWRPDFSWYRRVTGSFLVAAYRRPDFRVDVSLDAVSAVAGDPITGTVTARYLFGAAMPGRPMRWTWIRTPTDDVPAPIETRYGSDRWIFAGWTGDDRPNREEVASNDAKLAADGTLSVPLDTRPGNGLPWRYTFEADVEDISRQHIANRTHAVVHPAAFYVGLQRPSYFIEAKNGFDTAVVTVAPDGTPVPDIDVEVRLIQVQWHSVRRAEGQGFYTWETERRDVEAGRWTVRSGVEPTPLHATIPSGGYFELHARALDADGRATTTATSFYALGNGYTAWTRYDHNRIDLVPERTSYKPGDTARIMVQSPWEQATALVTTEREGIRSHRRFTLNSTQETLFIPIADADIPNVYVSVLLIKGRTAPGGEDDGSDPGKPAFRLGYTELAVEDTARRLTVNVHANRQEYRPAGEAEIDVTVTDHRGAAARSEVTLWAVDYGVLSLTGYEPPDVASSVYVKKALQVSTQDNRQRIVSRRVLTPKGSSDGGGGGVDPGVTTVRKDFRTLAFWVGSVITDANGRARREIRLPESLTTYRIMAVAADRASRFGNGSTEIRINKPVTLQPAFPRFLTLNDRAFFGSVVTNQLTRKGDATVTVTSLDPNVLEVTGQASRRLEVAAGGSAEARFEFRARALGRARVRMAVRLEGQSDSYEEAIPIVVATAPEASAAHGSAPPTATERIEVPAQALPGTGTLGIELASTALVGLGEGARYLVEYPYGCAEQRASRTLALLLAADLGGAFSIPGMDVPAMKAAARAAIRELERFGCPDGSFSFWPGSCGFENPYVSSYVVHVLATARRLGYPVHRTLLDTSYLWLEQKLNEPPPVPEPLWPAYVAWQALAVKVLAEDGRNVDAAMTRLYELRDRSPIFALGWLLDAMHARNERGPRPAELQRRIANASRREAANAYIEERGEPELEYYWSTNVRTTAIVLQALVTGRAPAAEVQGLARWLVAARRNGRWSNTQENAWALGALVAYYRAYEPAPPDFTALVRLDGRELQKAVFEGRSLEAVTKQLPLEDVASPGASRAIEFTREGTGTLYYTARLRYAVDPASAPAAAEGFTVSRRYEKVTAGGGAELPSTSFKAGDLVRVTLTFDLPRERRYVAVEDPLPAGFEPVDTTLATTASEGLAGIDVGATGGADATRWWRRSGFDHVERHDDRVRVFATTLPQGRHEYSYLVRATTTGTFRTAGTRVEEMYTPDVFARGEPVAVEVSR